MSAEPAAALPLSRKPISYWRAKYYFDRRAANHIIKFAERECCHVEGELAGQLVRLEHWQKRWLRRLFGWKHRDTGQRRFRVFYLEIARKNGKSLLASIIALYLLVADKEPGAKVVSAAADREQAALVYETAAKMVQANPRLTSMLVLYRRTMFTHDRLNKYEVLSADVSNKHGKNLSGIVVDELHAQPGRHLVDVLKTSTGARRQPLQVYLTTAGDDKNSVCWEYHVKARSIIAGLIEDESFLAVIYSLDDGDDWKEPSNWYKANPNIDVSIKRDYLEQEFANALASPSYENTFKRLHLCQWTEQETRWLPVEHWEACQAAADFDWSTLDGEECFGGVDLGQSSDLSALVLAFPRGQDVYIKQYLWTPEDAVEFRAKQGLADYNAWVNYGWLETTQGQITDHDKIRETILELNDRYYIRRMGIDRPTATQLGVQLEKDGVDVVMLSQTFKSLGPATKRLEELLLSTRLRHDGNPVMRWMFANIAIVTDGEGNVRISKKKSREKIDGISALVNAISQLLLFADEGGDSVYNQRGIVFL